MPKYSKEEIKVFEDKELRIVRQAILKVLIKACKQEDIYGIDKVTELSEKYVDYVYSERKTERKMGCASGVTGEKEEIKWVELAKGLNLAIPNEENIKILNLIIDEYNKTHKASTNPIEVLSHIMATFGKYPISQKSVSVVLDSIKN